MRLLIRAGDAEAATAAAILAWVFVHSTLRVPKTIGATCALLAYGLVLRKRIRLTAHPQEALGIPLRAYLMLLILVRMGDLAWDGLSPRNAISLVASSLLIPMISWIFADLWSHLRARGQTQRSDDGLLVARIVLALVGTGVLIRGQTVLALAFATGIALGDNSYAASAQRSDPSAQPQVSVQNSRSMWAAIAFIATTLWFALRSGVLGSVSVFLR